MRLNNHDLNRNKDILLRITLNKKGVDKITHLKSFLDMLVEQNKLIKLQIKSTNRIIKYELKELKK